MQTQTAKMIYAQETVANMIAGKMTKAKGKHVVMKVATGFQVCPVTICQGAISPHKAAPIPTKIDHFKEAAIETETVTVTMKFKAESPKYVTVIGPDGKDMHFGKGTLIAWEVTDTGSFDGTHQPATVKLKLSKATAKKRGLLVG